MPVGYLRFRKGITMHLMFFIAYDLEAAIVLQMVPFSVVYISAKLLIEML